jgi:hypothetical protein
MSNPKVFFDVTIGGAAAGRIVFEVSCELKRKQMQNFSFAPLFHEWQSY